MTPSSSKFKKPTDSHFSTSGRRQEPRFNLRVPESKKTKDWFIDYMEYVVPSENTLIDDYDQMKSCYEIYNGDLRKIKQALLDFSNPLGDIGIDSIDDELIAYPKLHNKVNVLKGELLKRGDNHKVILLSAQAIQKKNKELQARIKDSVEEKTYLELKKMEFELKGMSPPQINEYIAQLRRSEEPEDILRKDFSSEWEIFYNKVLKFAEYNESLTMKRMETIEDLTIADRCFIYCGWKYGKPNLEVRNVLYTGFEKDPNEFFIQKGDYVYYRKPITVVEAYNDWAQYLTEDELQELGLYTQNSAIDKRHDVRGGLAVPVFDHIDEHLFKSLEGTRSSIDKEIGTHMGRSTRLSNNNLIWETHFEFKAFRELDFLSYLDEYNEEVTVMLEDFDIPDDAIEEKFTNRFGDTSTRYVWFDDIMEQEYKLERLWIPRKYEVVRLGQNIYPIYREVPFQTTDIERPYSTFELSTKGAIFTSRNSKSKSLVQRAIPAYMQYLYIKHVQNRELAKYKGFIQSVDVDQIPDNLGQDIHGNQIRDKVSSYLATLRKSNIDFYSGSQSSQGGLPPATRSPGSSGYTLGVATELYNLQMLADLSDREIGISMGIAPEREAMFAKGTNVTDNQQALVQSYNITEPYFFMHSEVWRSVLNDYLINFRTYAERIFEANPEKSEHFLHYFLQNGTEELLKITPSMLDHISIGLQVSNSGADKDYRDVMLQQLPYLSQGKGEGLAAISSIAKAITANASPEEVHKMIMIEMDKQAERMAQANKAQIEAEAGARREIREDREDVQRHEIEKIVIKEEEQRETELKKAAILTYMGAEDKDLNDNNIPDPIELAKLEQAADFKEKDIKLKEKELAQKKELEIKKINKPISSK